MQGAAVYDDQDEDPFADGATGEPIGPGLMETAVRSQLSRWQISAERDPFAASVLDMARALDDPGLSATPRSMLQAQFRMTMQELIKAAPVEQAHDGIDDVRAQREKRRGA